MEKQDDGQGLGRRLRKDWGLKLALVLFAMIWLAVIGSTWADAAEGDEYNFNWLDPDKKIYVLQNRRYTKANHALVSLMAGPGVSNPFRTTLNFDGRLAYYPFETWGIEALYQTTVNSPSSTFNALVAADTSVYPNVREVRSTYGALVHWAPFYSKLNFFNKILYFDWYFSAGAGQVATFVDMRATSGAGANFQEQDFFAPMAGTGMQFHLSEMWTIRLDFTGAFFNAPVLKTTGETAWFSNYNFDLGIGLRI